MCNVSTRKQKNRVAIPNRTEMGMQALRATMNARKTTLDSQAFVPGWMRENCANAVENHALHYAGHRLSTRAHIQTMRSHYESYCKALTFLGVALYYAT